MPATTRGATQRDRAARQHASSGVRAGSSGGEPSSAPRRSSRQAAQQPFAGRSGQGGSGNGAGGGRGGRNGGQGRPDDGDGDSSGSDKEDSSAEDDFDARVQAHVIALMAMFEPNHKTALELRDTRPANAADLEEDDTYPADQNRSRLYRHLTSVIIQLVRNDQDLNRIRSVASNSEIAERMAHNAIRRFRMVSQNLDRDFTQPNVGHDVIRAVANYKTAYEDMNTIYTRRAAFLRAETGRRLVEYMIQVLEKFVTNDRDYYANSPGARMSYSTEHHRNIYRAWISTGDPVWCISALGRIAADHLMPHSERLKALYRLMYAQSPDAIGLLQAFWIQIQRLEPQR